MKMQTHENKFKVIFHCDKFIVELELINISGMICFSYLTDFSYFPLKIVFRKLLDMVRTGQKWPFWKGL